jgi:hypothetical protein
MMITVAYLDWCYFDSDGLAIEALKKVSEQNK